MSITIQTKLTKPCWNLLQRTLFADISKFVFLANSSLETFDMCYDCHQTSYSSPRALLRSYWWSWLASDINMFKHFLTQKFHNWFFERFLLIFVNHLQLSGMLKSCVVGNKRCSLLCSSRHLSLERFYSHETPARFMSVE